MKWFQRLVWAGYFLVFGLTSLGVLESLLYTGNESFVYYHILISLYKPALVVYYLAIAAAGMSLVSLGPVFCRIFNVSIRWTKFMRFLFFFRLCIEIVGHNYEWQTFKAMLSSEPRAAFAMLLLYLLFLLPSYDAHFKLAFRPKT